MKIVSFNRLERRQLVDSACAVGRIGVAAMLCLLMIDLPVLGETNVHRSPKAPPAAAQIRGQERALHALDRLTFGPRPGDVAAVEAMGLSAWFERQLNPAKIDDSALEAKLAMFPAMQMPQQQLVERYPGPQMLRQLEQGKGQMPTDPTVRAIYKDDLAFYKKAKVKQEAAQASGSTAANNAMGDSMTAGGGDAVMAPPSPAPIVRKQRNAKVDLLGDSGASVMSKKNAGGGDAMAAEAGKAASGDPAPDDANLTGKGKREHDERFFPETKASAILALAPEQRLQAILALQPDQLVAFRKSLSQAEIAAVAQGLNPLQRETLAALQGSARLVGGEVLESRMMRDVYSDRQLEAVMTDFWLNHFNVYLKKNQQEPYLLPAYERETIRPNALGKFETLLVASAKSPAMLTYLDNFQSVGPDSLAAKQAPKLAQYAKNPQVKAALKDRGLNENYARELMELHTVGVQCEVSKDRPVSMLPASCGQGYTQADVTEVAKVLTGWTIDRPQQGGEYQFNERRHEPGDKHVLGTTIRASGEAEGMQVLHLLATSPATAHFISYKLAVRFVSDTPPDALVDRMAKSFVDSKGDIKTVLRTMFQAPEFWSPAVYRAKVKTPEEFVISAVRASGAQVQNALPLVQALNQLGMGFYGMQTPNGYSWLSEPWVSTGALVSRMNFALVLAGNRLNGTRVNWDRVPGEAGDAEPTEALTVNGGSETAQAKEKVLEAMLLGQPVSDKTRATVLAQSENAGATEQAAKNFSAQAGSDAIASAGSGDTPRGRGQQPQDRQAAVIAGLLLGSPEFQKR
jgi:uncharacterized protein (DUF1800 family)